MTIKIGPLPLIALTALLTLSAGRLQADPGAAAQKPALPLALHKAVYDLRMKSAEQGARLSNISGKMYFEQDATCDAWTSEQRFNTTSEYADESPFTDTSHYVSYETRDGAQLTFNSEREDEGAEPELLRGTVTRAPDGAGQAIFSRPDDLKFDLPKGYLLPAAHTLEIIRRARAGEHLFNAVMFDGTDASGPAEVSTFIGPRATAAELGKIADASGKIDKSLITPEAWHVRMAIFPLEEKEDMTPAYEMDLVLHDNGVISHALVDYKTFTVEQSLAGLEKLPSPRKCD